MLQRRAYVEGADSAQLRSACNLSLAKYLQDPDKYDPERGPLVGWLLLDAQRDVLNDLTSAAARREHAEATVVELRADVRNVHQDAAGERSVEEQALDLADPYDLPPLVVDAVRQATSGFSNEDRAIVELMGEGVRETAAYAAVLGIAHLPDDVQRRETKQAKDRLNRRLERLRERLAD